MTAADRSIAVLLAAAGLLLWHETAAQAAMGMPDALPLLAAGPLFIIWGGPWRWRTAVPASTAAGALLPGAALATAGYALGVPLLAAVGLCVALGRWLAVRTEISRPRLGRLLLLPLFAIPWLVGSGGIGWHFRLSAAWLAEQFFVSAGMAVTRSGTELLVQGEALAVEAACAGLGSLQALMLAGTAAAVRERPESPGFWWCIAVLPAAAWIANTLRVLLLCAVALSAGPEFVRGTFHGLAGAAVVLAVFAVCLRLFRPRSARRVEVRTTVNHTISTT